MSAQNFLCLFFRDFKENDMFSKKRMVILLTEMFYSFKDREDLENLSELVSLQSQVKAFKLRDELGQQVFREVMKKVFEPELGTIKDVSEDILETIMVNSIENNQALENLNNKRLETVNDRSSKCVS